MAAAVEPDLIKEAMLVLATAGIVVPLFGKLKVSPVLGFIGVGALIGPYGFGRFGDAMPWLGVLTIRNGERVGHFAELGVVFLLFMIGLELSWERLRTLRRLVFGLGAAQVVACSAVLASCGVWLGLRPGQALVGGLALALSSTAIVVPLLAGQKRLNAPTGRAAFSVLLFQDLAVAPVLFTISAVDAAGTGGLLQGVLLALAQAAVALVVIVSVGRLALRPLFQLVAQTRSPESFMAACLLTIAGTALVSAASGLSMALGAFVAGLLLAETEYRRAVEAMIDPFKGLLLGVFFLSVGMGLDVTAILHAPVTILAVSVGLVVLKAGVIATLGRLFGLPRRVGLETGLLLGAGGEFAFVLVGAAAAARLVPADLGQALLVVTSVTMVLIPLLARLGRRLGRRRGVPAGPGAVAPASGEAADRVLVAGFGRVGQLVCEMLERHAVPYLAVDSNPALVAAQRALGRPVYFGDSTSTLFLRACGIESARALVITLDQPSASQALIETVRRWKRDLTIVARARDGRHATLLYRLGATDAVPETIEASLQLSEAVLVDIGVPMGLVIASVHERREEYRRGFQTVGPDGEARADRPRFLGRRRPGRRAV